MTRSVRSFYSTDETGAIIPQAEISVNFAGGAEAPIYTVNSGGTPVSQPLISTSSGKAVFYVEPGVFDIESKDPVSLTTSTFSNEEIGVARGKLTKDTDVDFYFSAAEDLINHTFDSAVEAGAIALSSGYSTKGIGEGKWQHNGVTGETPSQSPAQLGDGLLNDGNGNQWSLVVDGLFIQSSALGVIGDNATDSYLALIASKQAAITHQVSYINLPSGDILTSDEIQLDSEGLMLVGAGTGSKKDGVNRYKTRLVGTNTLRAVVRIMLESCGIKDLLVDSDTTRSAAAMDLTAANFNCGIRIEAEDVAAPEGDVFNTRIINSHVVNQPNDGVTIAGRCYNSEIECDAHDNAGHAMNVTNGEYTGRTNTAIAGVINFNSSEWGENGGHGLKLGANNDTDYTLRVVVNNCEGLNNLGDVALAEDLSDSFYHCDGLTVINGASTGEDKAGAPNANAGVALKGNGGTLLNHRILSTSEPIRIIKTGTRATQGWNIIEPLIRGTLSSYIVNLQAGVKNITIVSGDETGALTSATNITGITGLNIIFNDEKYSNADYTHEGDLLVNGLNLRPEKLNNQNVTTTPLVILDASVVGKMWKVSLRHTSDPCLSSCTFEIVGGSTPVISNIANQTGAAVTYLPTVNGTNIEIATSAGTRSSDIYIAELVTA
jgi:hypothetical protein